MIAGISHLTFMVRDLDRMEQLLTRVLDARKVYDSGAATFSLASERFFLIGGDPAREEPATVWVAIMEGEGPAGRTYDHVAFRIADADYDDRLARVQSLGLEVRASRPRVEGEGRSIYFYDHDNHLFELHTGTLPERLARYRQG